MADPRPCPRPNVRQALQDGLPKWTFGFLLACRGGVGVIASTRSDLHIEGCAADQAFIPIQVKWEDIVNQGWIASGGNRYWSTSIPASASDPRVTAVLRLLAGRSATAFVETWDRVTGKTMADVMAPGAWVTKVGIMTVPVTPSPQETPAAFVARGGYLFDMRPGFSSILGGKAWQAQGASSYPFLAESSVRSVQLWGDYDANKEKINYTVRVEYEGSWTENVNVVDKYIRAGLGTACGKLVENAGVAMTVSTAFPAAKPYMTAYKAALVVCNIGISQIQPAPCVPFAPRPEDLLAPIGNAKVLFTGGTGKAAMSAQIPGMTATFAVDAGTGAPAAGTNPPPLPPPPPAMYPPGTIAWRASASTGFDIAVPTGSDKITHRVVKTGVPTLPAEVFVVDRAAWEKATLPWVKRTSTKIGAGIGGGLVAVTGAVLAVVAGRR